MQFRDLTYAIRTLRRSPVFAVTGIATIALGIGVSTAIFSVTNAVLLQPLPYKNPDRLVLALGEFKKRSVTDWPFSNANFLDLRDGAKTMFEDFTAVNVVRAIFSKGMAPSIRFGSRPSPRTSFASWVQGLYWDGISWRLTRSKSPVRRMHKRFSACQLSRS
jgi:hypothetical protein